MRKMEKDLLKIIKHYGVIPQLKYFQSEVFELNEAIIRYNEADYNYFEGYTFSDGDELINHIKEEIADVLCMLRQFQYKFKISDEDIDKIIEFKVNRQLTRMENEKKGKKHEIQNEQ